MDTILTSFLTSLIVSLVTFVLGLKAGKNQSDRKYLQDLYKKLHVHFRDLKDGLGHLWICSLEAYTKPYKSMIHPKLYMPSGYIL